MAPVPIDEGWPARRRLGPFWIEEGYGVLAFGAGVIVMVTILYLAAFLLGPT